MFCRNCGTENADGAPTCISCGQPLSNNPYAAGAAPQGHKPANYLIQSILVTLCCCLPLGIVAIVYAAQVDSKWNAGDSQGAILAAENAKKWCWIGLGLGILLNLVVLGLQVVAVMGAAANAQGGGGF